MRSPWVRSLVAASIAVSSLVGVVATANAAAEPSWAGRAIVVSDRTGDPRWRAATRYAVAAWNSSGADVTLWWSEGGVGCGPEGTTVAVCRSALPSGVVGVAATWSVGGDMAGSTVRVTYRRVGQLRANAIATHEVGHALGLDHSSASGALMGPAGNGTDHLAPEDHQALLSLYGRSGG